jgi:hypothetical protein
MKKKKDHVKLPLNSHLEIEKMVQPGSLPPAHPSLPSAPRFSAVYLQDGTPSSYAHLSSQHAGTSSPYMSPHYAEAYMQGTTSGWRQSATIAQGYNSSVYSLGQSHPISSVLFGNTNGLAVANPPLPFRNQGSSWYQPGESKCTYKGCTFTGSHKTVETHMMDRHLIYPPGWEKRKKQNDWDADPSLKGFVKNI